MKSSSSHGKYQMDTHVSFTMRKGPWGEVGKYQIDTQHSSCLIPHLTLHQAKYQTDTLKKKSYENHDQLQIISIKAKYQIDTLIKTPKLHPDSWRNHWATPVHSIYQNPLSWRKDRVMTEKYQMDTRSSHAFASELWKNVPPNCHAF